MILFLLILTLFYKSEFSKKKRTIKGKKRTENRSSLMGKSAKGKVTYGKGRGEKRMKNKLKDYFTRIFVTSPS